MLLLHPRNTDTQVQNAAFMHDAFVSYSRRDTAFASRLEQMLEAYTPPKDLNLPRRHMDIFRDTDDFEAGDYYRNLEKHLAASRKLIVVCSPNSRASKYVNEEIERFITLRGRANVIPILLSGLPNNEAGAGQELEKAFPQALCQAVEVPLAAEYRGFDSANAKLDKGVYYGAWYSVLAALFDVGRGEIEQRDAKRRAQTRRMWTSGVATVMAVLSVLTVWALFERTQAIEQARTALSRQLAAQSSNLFGSNLQERSLLLALAANQIKPTLESTDSLFDSLKAHGYLKKYSGENGSYPTSVAFSPDGKTLAFGTKDMKIFLLDVATGAQRAVLTDHQSWVWSVAFSADGKTLASGSLDKTLILWDAATGRPIGQPLTGHQDAVKSVAFSPDGRMVASGSWDKTVMLWDVASHQPIGEPLRGHTDKVSGVAFSPDGKTVASGSWDKTVKLWDVASHQPTGSLLDEDNGGVLSIAFSSDGKTLASGNGDNTIVLWDLASRRPVGSPLERHNGSVLSIAFSPDGKTLASGSEDNTIILWDVANRFPRVVLTGHAGTQQGTDKGRVRSVAFNTDGKTLASAGSEHPVLLWRIDIDGLASQACTIVTRNLTREEWRMYIGDMLPYQPVCKYLPNQ